MTMKTTMRVSETEQLELLVNRLLADDSKLELHLKITLMLLQYKNDKPAIKRFIKKL